jgi:hypothetical protein
MAPSDNETLIKIVKRASARWLKRVMYHSLATSTEKCFAFTVADHLNCVTLDAWPGLATVASRLGFKSTRTVCRAATRLEQLGLLSVTRVRGVYRFAPIFVAEDGVTDVTESGHSGPASTDRNVHESLLGILITSEPRGPAEQANGETVSSHRRPWHQRGAIEVKVAKWLGNPGVDLLARLGQLDDAHVDRLCRAYEAGMLTERELAAARLAAEQVRP